MAKNETFDQTKDIVRIPSCAYVKGFLKSESDIRIDGAFDGVLYSKGRIILGQEAKCNGRIFSNTIEIQGNFEGEVYACDVMHLHSSAIFKGVCNTVKISIDLGAKFSANCNMITSDDYAREVEKLEPEKTIVPEAAEA